MDLIFEWDERKAKENLKKHHVSFDQGATIFDDPFVETIHDPDHSGEEARYISIGISVKRFVLVIVHTERSGKTRLISCRKATAAERRRYEEDKDSTREKRF